MATDVKPEAFMVLPDGRKVVKAKRCSCKNKSVDASKLDPGTLSAIKTAKSKRPGSAPAGSGGKKQFKKTDRPQTATDKYKTPQQKPGIPGSGDAKKPLNELIPWDGKKKPKRESSLDELPHKPGFGGFGFKKPPAEKEKEKDKEGGTGKGKGKGKGKPGGGTGDATAEKPKKPKVEYPKIEPPKKKWVPPDQCKKKSTKKPGIPVPKPQQKPWVPPDQRPKPPKKPPFKAPAPPTKKWVPPDQRKKSKKQKPKITYPPFAMKKWIPPYLRPKKKHGPKYIKPDGITQKLEFSNLYKIWNEYRFYDNYACLTGHWSQTNKRYNYRTNGYQGGCNATVAIAISHIYGMEIWDEQLMDRILDLGDQLYEHSMNFVENKCDPYLKLQDIYSTFYINNAKITMAYQGEKFSAKLFKDYDDAPALKEVLEDFFSEYNSGILTTQKKHFGIWHVGKGYYLFDPTDHQLDGMPWTEVAGKGYSAVMRAVTILKLVELIAYNVDYINNSKFTITPCYILRLTPVTTEFPMCLKESEAKKLKEKVPIIVEQKESFEELFGDENDDDWQQVPGAEAEGEMEAAGEGAEGPVKVDKKKPLPQDKPRAESVTYFLELLPEKYGILRASTHQEDPNFTKYMGSQSIANAVAAISMLRKTKSKYWTPHIVNEILKLGEHIHHDTKKLLPPGEELTVKKVCKKITIDEAVYTPEIEEYSIIGQLQSKKLELLDLLPALQEFFRNRDSCIVNGPLTIAVWQENNIFYMFDPSERNQNGLAITKTIIQGSKTIIPEFTPGYACVTWYSDLQNLVNIYMNNTPRPQRRDKFILSNVEIKEYVEIPQDWNSFKGIIDSKWILRADMSQSNVIFSKATRNVQCTANAIMAILYTRLLDIEKWTTTTMNEILINGDKFYSSCVEQLKDRGKFVDPMLMVDEIQRTYTIQKKMVKFDIDDCIINGLLNAKDTDKDMFNLLRGLREFFKDNDYAVVTLRNISVAVFKLKEIYYYYDSHSRDEYGHMKSFGTSCIIRCTNLGDIVMALEANLKPGLSNLFNISRIEMDIWDESEDMVVKPPLQNFTEISPGAAILRAAFSENDPKYHTNAGKQTVPNLLLALGLSKMLEGNDWNRDLMDELLNTGDKNYDECMMKLREGKLETNFDPSTKVVEEEEEVPPPPEPPSAPPTTGRGKRGGGSGIIKLRGGGDGLKEYQENTENEIVYLLSLPSVINNPNLHYHMENLAKAYPQFVQKSKEQSSMKPKFKKQNFISENRNKVKRTSKQKKTSKEQSMQSEGSAVLRLRGGGGRNEAEGNTENEIVSLLTMPRVVENANLSYAMKNFAKNYPDFVRKARSQSNKRQFHKFHDYVKENKRDVKIKSSCNTAAKKALISHSSGTLSSPTTLIKLTRGFTSSMFELEKRDKTMSSFIKLIEGDPKVHKLMKSLSAVYPNMFNKTLQIKDILMAELEEKRKLEIAKSIDLKNINNLSNQSTPNVKVPTCESGRFTVRFPYKVRGGMDRYSPASLHDYQDENKKNNDNPFEMMSFSTFADIGPLKKVYKRKRELEDMLDYRTRLAEVLLRKSLLHRTKSRGGGDEPFEEDEMEGMEEEEEEKVNEDITISNVIPEFKIGVNKVKISFETMSEGILEYDLKQVLLEFLKEDVPEEDHRELILDSPLMKIAIWKDNNLFFVYDPKPRNEVGKAYGWDLSDIKLEEEDFFGEEMMEEENLGYMENPAGGDAALDLEASESREELEEAPARGGGEESPFQGEEAVAEEEEERRLDELTSAPVTSSEPPENWKEMEKEEGKACILWFTKPDLLLEYILENAPSRGLGIPYTLKRLYVLNIPDVKNVYDPTFGPKKEWYDGDWYAFKEIDHGRWILRGTIDQFNVLFPESNRGKQTVANCFTALAYVYMYAIQKFKYHTIDDILKYGDRLYTFTKKLRRKELLENKEFNINEAEAQAIMDKEVYSVKEIVKRFCMGKYETVIAAHYEHLTGEINAQEFPEIFDVKRGLESFFRSNRFGILCAKKLCVAIWRGERMKYMFDPNPRGPDGVFEFNGVACITRYRDCETLANVFLSNLPKEGNNFFTIHKIDVSRETCKRIPKVEEENKPEVISITGYTPAVPGKYILRGHLSADDPKFGRGTNQFPGPIAVVALAMTFIHKCSNWSKPIVDEILVHGDNLYATTLDTLGFSFNPWEQKLELSMIPPDFNIGCVKVNFSLRNNDQKGIIAIKNPNVPNLRIGLEKFFEENSHGILETELLTVAVWEDEVDNFIYMYDPNPRSATGMPVPNDGTACVLCFDSFKNAADHFVSLLPNEVKRQGEFTITPLEIIVGKKKTRNKREHSPKLPRNRCTEAILEKKRKEEEARKRREAERCAKLGKNEFYNVPPGDMGLLRGTKSILSKLYSPYSRGFQDIPVCIVAFVMDRLLPVKNWNWGTINTILDVGDQLYKDSYIMYNPKERNLGLEYVIRKIIIKDIQVQIQVCKPVMINQLTLLNINEVLEVALMRKPVWLLNCGNRWLLIFQRDGQYYAFDPRDIDLRGNYVEAGAGCASVLRFLSVKLMAEKLYINLFRGEDDLFCVSALGIKSFEKIAKCEC